jgi:hypothetical protein
MLGDEIVDGLFCKLDRLGINQRSDHNIAVAMKLGDLVGCQLM